GSHSSVRAHARTDALHLNARPSAARFLPGRRARRHGAGWRVVCAGKLAKAVRRSDVMGRRRRAALLFHKPERAAWPLRRTLRRADDVLRTGALAESRRAARADGAGRMDARAFSRALALVQGYCASAHGAAARK